MADDTFARVLTDARVRNAAPKDKPYKLPDGGGMYLLVNPNGSKLWRYKFRLNAAEGLDALGSYPDVNLSAARELHRASRTLVAQGVNPVHHRKAERERAERERALAAAGLFDTAAEAWLDRCTKTLAASTVAHRKRDLNKYLLPKFKGRSLPDITRAEIAQVLKDVMATKPSVAQNLRAYLFDIFESAYDEGLVTSNPVPPGRAIVKPEAEHHKALDVDRVGEFLVRLHDAPNVEPPTRVAMMLTIYGVTRKVEAISARPEHFNLKDVASLEDKASASWNLPKEVMKGKKKNKREHWVPLPRQALTMLREYMEWHTGEPYLFPNVRSPGAHMAMGTLNAVLRRLGYDGEATVHGFRAMFSTRYNADPLNADVVERCLAHKPKDRTRAAYNRHDYAMQRRALLQDWADWLHTLMDAERAKQERLVA